MSGEATAAQASPGRLLPSAAVGHLADELRGSLHVIRGHAELLQEGRGRCGIPRSAGFILDASIRLAGLCEDVIDLLRLPVLAPATRIPLALHDLLPVLERVAAGRGVELHMVEPRDDEGVVLVDATVRRFVANVLEHVVRNAETVVTIAASLQPGTDPPEMCMIAASPVPSGAIEYGTGVVDGRIAIASELLRGLRRVPRGLRPPNRAHRSRLRAIVVVTARILVVDDDAESRSLVQPRWSARASACSRPVTGRRRSKWSRPTARIWSCST